MKENYLIDFSISFILSYEIISLCMCIKGRDKIEIKENEKL